MDSIEMKNIIETCSYSIAPSYADGLPGGTIEPMSAGLIPIVSKYCGFPKEDFIFEIPELTLHSINQTIDSAINLDNATYLTYSEKVKEYAIKNYSRENIKQNFTSILTEILK